MTDNSVEIKEYEQVVECIVGSETYALPISWVQEIIQPQPVTPIPRAHPAIWGLHLFVEKFFPSSIWRRFLKEKIGMGRIADLSL